MIKFRKWSFARAKSSPNWEAPPKSKPLAKGSKWKSSHPHRRCSSRNEDALISLIEQLATLPCKPSAFVNGAAANSFVRKQRFTRWMIVRPLDEKLKLFSLAQG